MNNLDAFDNDPNYLKGLGGWLIVVAIGLIANPAIISYQLYTVFLPIFSDGTFELLTNPYSEYLIPNFSSMIYLEIAVNIAMIVYWLTLIVLFFYKHKAFPKAFIAIVIATPIIFLGDSYMASTVVPQMEMFDEEGVKILTRSLLYAAIWIPYMLRSERVRKTFTRSFKDDLNAEPPINPDKQIA